MIGTPALPSVVMQIPVMISASSQVLLSVHGFLFPCPENSVSSLANLEARRGEASGQCAMSVRTGDGTVLITLQGLLSLTRESHLPWHCCNPSIPAMPAPQLCLVMLVGLDSYSTGLIGIGHWTSFSSEPLFHCSEAAPILTFPSLLGCHFL